jgi:hypothetical protein
MARKEPVMAAWSMQTGGSLKAGGMGWESARAHKPNNPRSHTLAVRCQRDDPALAQKCCQLPGVNAALDLHVTQPYKQTN